MSARLSLAAQIAELAETAPITLEIEDPQQHVPEQSEPISGQEQEDASQSQGSDTDEDPATAEESDSAPPRVQDVPEPQTNAHDKSDLTSSLRHTREADHRKGKAVSRQLALWDSLLDARIQMQKAVTAVHKLPQRVHLQAATSHQATQDSLARTLTEAALLTEELFDLQESLMDPDDRASLRPRKRVKLDDGHMLQGDPAECFVDLSQSASVLEAALHPRVVQTFNKWSSKVQTVAPNLLLPDRTSFKQSDRKVPLSGLAVVDDVLRFDGEKLLARTRVVKGPTAQRKGQPDEDEDVESVEVFDDTDFYQQLLRDVIKMRGAASGEPQWLEQQRKNKATRKKTVDTKASKGRKLRYETHEKLQHFMVPVVRGGWHEEQIDVLFSSLLGGHSV